jgi:hypothetical protein
MGARQQPCRRQPGNAGTDDSDAFAALLFFHGSVYLTRSTSA